MAPPSASHPAAALFPGEKPFPVIPACEHIAGTEKLIVKSLELQKSMGRLFDVTATARTAPRRARRSSTRR